MLVAIIKVNKELRKLASKKEKLSIKQANERLIALDKYAEENQMISEIELTIFEGEDVCFRDIVTIGEGKARNLILLVNSTLNKTFQDTPVSEKEALLNKLTNALNEQSVTLPVPKIQENTELKPKIKKQPKMVKKKWNIKSFKIPFSIKKIKLPLIIVGVFVLIFLGVKTGTAYFLQEKPFLTVNYQELIEQEHYLKAAEDYPDKREEIESYLFEKADTVNLQKFVAQYPSDVGKFDLAFLKKEWNSVIENATEDVQMTEEKQAILAFSYLKVGNLDKAREMNETLKSAELTRMISNYQLYQNTLKKFEKQLEQDGLSEDEKEDIQSNIQAIKDQINTIGE